MRFAVMQEITLLFAAIALTVAGSLSETTRAPSPAPTSLETARNYYLSDLIKAPSYTPGKNSFFVQNFTAEIERTTSSQREWLRPPHLVHMEHSRMRAKKRTAQSALVDRVAAKQLYGLRLS